MGHKKLDTSDPSKDYPDFLKRIYKTKKNNESHNHPIIIKMDKVSSEKELNELIKKVEITEIIDNYAEQYAELLLSKNAHLYRANYDVQVASIKEMIKKHYGVAKPWHRGSWIYYPWSRQLVHVLEQKDFEELRTIRNKELITSAEQNSLFEFDVACFGMSVGSASALALSLSGISRRMKLVDGAVISGSNLNRILTGINSIGQEKATVIGQKVYEMNPYFTVSYFDKVDTKNIGDIFDNPWPIKLAIDEIDDITMKVRIRLEARKRKIPVLMATELGDTVMLDVERFDLEPNRPIFHNSMPDIEGVSETDLENYRDWTKRAVKIIDPINMPIKMQESVLKIGTTIVTHPQLGSTVMITGGIIAFAIKNIVNNELKSGRYVISLEKIFLESHQSIKYKLNHKRHTKIIQNAVNSM